MKKVVVTGATSLVGVALIDECVANGVKVLALVRKDSKKLARLPKSPLITIAECGLEEMKDFSFSECDYDVFYHFGWSHTDKQGRCSPELQQENIAFSIDAVKLAHKLGCNKFVGAGSQAEYGSHHGGSTSPSTPIAPLDAYGASKAAAGQLCRIEAERLGMNGIWVRIFSLYGKFEVTDTLIQITIDKMLKNEHCSFSPCLHQWDYLYSADAGKAIFLIGERAESSSVYCLGSGVGKPLREYVEEMKKVLSSESELGFGDYPYNGGVPNGICADISSLTADTGWKPTTSFADGIQEEAKRRTDKIRKAL